MSDPWIPKRTLSESMKSGRMVPVEFLTSLIAADRILCAPGMPHEMETRLIGNQVLRVYKNLWPSIRDFWAFVSNEYKDSTYIVFEKQHWTYGQISDRVTLASRVFEVKYGIRKGDRVAICSRNFPDFIVAFWACHLLGAVSVLVNAYVTALAVPLFDPKHSPMIVGIFFQLCTTVSFIHKPS